jgi:hypothetical protein
LFVFIFPIFGWGMVVLLGRRQRPGEKFRSHAGVSALRLPYLPWPLIVAGIVLIVACWGIGAHTFGDLPGQPAYDSATHQYTYNDHGEVVIISKDRYESIVKAQNRFFLVGIVTFTTVGLGIAIDESIRRTRRTTP